MSTERQLSKADIEDWNRVAGKYAEMNGTPGDRIYQQMKDVLWDALGDIRGLDVLDLGCGHGWLSNALVEAGAQVWGIDGSAELLKIARQLCPQAEFAEHDLSNGIPDTGQRFDRIVAYMVLMDIPELGDLLKSVRRVLRGDGKFIFTITHPCFFNYKARRDETTGQMYCGVAGYLQPDEWWIETFGGHRHYHRSLTYYFESLRAQRLAVTRLFEPAQIPYATEDVEFHRNIPKFLLMECVPI